ncbi:MAG: hypothetical protein EOO46_03790 [Flavobacterium sp.]|nr:MAG: hypothetical protein EOO46_03790 [Flavobacterium sp.]
MRYLVFIFFVLVSCKQNNGAQRLLFDQLKDAKDVYKDLMFRDAYNATKVKRVENNDFTNVDMLLKNYYKVETRIQNTNVENLDNLIIAENKKLQPYVGKVPSLKLLKLDDVTILEESQRKAFVDFYFAKVYCQIISNFAPTFCVYSNFS